MDRRRIREGGERALCYREAEEESRVSEGFCGFNRSREIWLGDLRGCDNLLQGLDLVIFILRGGEATRDEEDRETFGTRSGFGLMVIFRSGLRFLGWKRGDRGGSGRKGPVLLITYSWMTRSFQTFTILFPTQGLIKDTSRSEQVLIAAFGRVVFYFAWTRDSFTIRFYYLYALFAWHDAYWYEDIRKVFQARGWYLASLSSVILVSLDKNMERSQFGQVTMVTVMGVGSALNDMGLMRWSQGANEEDFFLSHDWVKRLMCLSGSVHFVFIFLIFWVMFTNAVLLGCFGLYGSQIWYAWVLKGCLLICSLLGGWNAWNKFVDFGVWICFKSLQRRDQNFLLMQFDVHGREIKELVHMCFVGFGMWLGTEQNALAARTRGLRLVSLNQLQRVSLERLKVLVLGTYSSVIVIGSGASTDLYMSYVKRVIYLFGFFIIVYMFGFSIMVFIGPNLKGEVELDIMYRLGMEQGSIFFILKLFTMTVNLGVRWIIASWWLGFQGIIKPNFAKLLGVFIYNFK